MHKSQLYEKSGVDSEYPSRISFRIRCKTIHSELDIREA